MDTQHNGLAVYYDPQAPRPNPVPQSLEIFSLVHTAIESFQGDATARFAAAVAEFNTWANSWQGTLPDPSEMVSLSRGTEPQSLYALRPSQLKLADEVPRLQEYAMDTLSDIFFLQTDPGVTFSWDVNCFIGHGALGMTRSLGQTAYPTEVAIDPGNFAQMQGVRDHQGAIVGTLLHEQCHVFLGKNACVGRCGSRVCREQALSKNTGHGLAWFMLALYVQLMARRLFDVDVRLSIFRSASADCKTLRDLPGRAFWQTLVERFNDDEIDSLLGEMKPDEERTFDNACQGDPFFGRRGLKVGIRRMQWARDGRLPGNEDG